MTRYWAVVALLAAQPACNDEAPDGTGMIIETVAEQPSDSGLGVSLAIHARGGRGVFVSVEQGELLALSTPGMPPVAQRSDCFTNPATAAPSPFTIGLSVRPDAQEALLFASLYAAGDCSGEIVQSRIVAVHPPAVTPVTVDAGAGVAREARP
jgi:hypothetical protein